MYDEVLAGRVRALLEPRGPLGERKMFGGLCFLLRGHMVAGITGDDLMLRLGEERADSALDEPHVRPMDFTGRPMKNMVFVGRAALGDDAALDGWLDRAVAFVETLPPKP